jgi:hypothetical protein
MNYNMFQFVLSEIREDDVFRNNSRNPQVPVEYQLMVALAKFGHYGNAMGVKSVARDFRVSGELAIRDVKAMQKLIQSVYNRRDRCDVDSSGHSRTPQHSRSMDSMA